MEQLVHITKLSKSTQRQVAAERIFLKQANKQKIKDGI